MSSNSKKLINSLSSKEVKEIIENNVKEIIVDDEDKTVSIYADSKHYLNLLSSWENIWDLIKWVKKAYWEDYQTIIKTENHKMKNEKTEHHDREMNIPHTIHFN